MTDFRTNAPGLTPMQHASGPEANQPAAIGSFRGTQAKVVSQASLIEDAIHDMAEEITFAASEETEKHVSERDVEDGRKSDSLERFLQLTSVKDVMKTLGDLNKRDVLRALKRLLTLLERGGGNAGALRKGAAEAFDDPSHQYAALTGLLEGLKARGAPPEQIAAAEQALSDLMADQGQTIRAALNIGETAQGYARSNLAEVPDLRDAYRTNVHDYKAAAEVVEDLVARFGEDKLDHSITFMLDALGHDLAAGGSSIDKTQLGLIMSDMKRLKTLATVLGNSGFLIRNARSLGGNDSFTAAALLRQLVPLQDAPRVQKGQILPIPEMAGLTQIDHQIRFLNDLRELVRLIPLDAYAKPESRDKLLDAVTDAIVEKGDQEEAQEDDAV